MARGNIYILIHGDDLTDLTPVKTRERYTYSEFDDLGNETVIEPTWEQLGSHYEPQFGLVRNNIYIDDGETYHGIEFETSFVRGEIQQILALGSPGNFPRYAILTATEMSIFLREGTIDT